MGAGKEKGSDEGSIASSLAYPEIVGILLHSLSSEHGIPVLHISKLMSNLLDSAKFCPFPVKIIPPCKQTTITSAYFSLRKHCLVYRIR